MRQKHWMGAAKILLSELPEWAKKTPYQIKKIAVEDAYLAFSNGCKKVKKTGQPFQLKYRSRKDTKQSCYIPSSALKDTGIYPRIAGKLNMSESIPDNHKDLRLIYENGRWFINVPYKTKIQPIENQNRVVALDPGIRTFLTGFSEDSVFKIGQQDFSRIVRLSRHCDKLISKMSKAKAKQKYRFKKALNRIKWKIWDLIDELHYKSINFLLNHYDKILLPTFETSEMVIKSKRKIQSKTARSMMTFAFYRFSQRLECKAKQLGKEIIRVNEAYTSKTASWTGEIKEKLGSAKFIKSNGLKMDRDINGARGIFLRALVDRPSLRNQCALLANSNVC